jgi:Barrier to autointegration factor
MLKWIVNDTPQSSILLNPAHSQSLDLCIELSCVMLVRVVLNFYFFQAYVVLGQYLVLKKDQELFMDWLKDTCSANTKQSTDCYNCLNDWCDEFL